MNGTDESGTRMFKGNMVLFGSEENLGKGKMGGQIQMLGKSVGLRRSGVRSG